MKWKTCEFGDTKYCEHLKELMSEKCTAPKPNPLAAAAAAAAAA